MRLLSGLVPMSIPVRAAWAVIGRPAMLGTSLLDWALDLKPTSSGSVAETRCKEATVERLNVVATIELADSIDAAPAHDTDMPTWSAGRMQPCLAA